MGNSNNNYKKFVTNVHTSAVTLAIESKKYDMLEKILDCNKRSPVADYDVVCDVDDWHYSTNSFFGNYNCSSHPDYYYNSNINELINVNYQKLDVCDANKFLTKLRQHPFICAILQSDITALEMLLKSNTILLTGFELFLACNIENVEIVKLFLAHTHPNQVLVIKKIFDKEYCAITLYEYVSALGKLNLVNLLIDHNVCTCESKIYKSNESTFTYVVAHNKSHRIYYDYS